MRTLPVLLLLLGLTFLTGCTTFRPFEEVRRSLPADRYVRVGHQLVYVEQAGPPDAMPVVLIHGFGASSYSWRKVQPGLSQRYRTLAIDLNGFGYTQRPRDAESYSREGQVKLILGVLDALGIERAHFVGHSYGGALTLWTAADHPERVRSFVLVDSAAPTYPNDRRSRAAAFKPLSALFLRAVALRPGAVRKALEHSVYDPSSITHEVVQAYFDRLRIEGAGNAYYGLTAPRFGSRETVDLTTIDIPALVVWGTDDKLVRIADGQAAAARMPRAQFVALPETGHMPMEERPEELLRLMLDFFARQG
jgi:pimeloyl-ACP methyl ester carboxylesterase